MSKMLRLIFTALLVATFAVGCATSTPPTPEAAAAPSKAEKKPVKQDQALVISTEEVAALVAKGPEEGSYQLIDARPAICVSRISTLSLPSPFCRKKSPQPKAGVPMILPYTTVSVPHRPVPWSISSEAVTTDS